MDALLIVRTTTFDIDADMNSLLDGLSNEDLDDFAETYEDLLSFEEVKLHIYALVLIFRRTGSVEHLEQAIQRTNAWIEQTTVDHPQHALQLRIRVQMLAEMTRHKLGPASTATAEKIGLVDSIMVNQINYAIEVADEALQATPRDHPDRVAILNDFAAWLGMRFTWAGPVEDLHRAIEVAREALQAAPKDYPDRSTVLTNLGTLLFKRFQKTDLLEDINSAINVSREALRVMAQDHHDRSTALINLGRCLGTRLQRTRSLNDLNQAIEVETMALEIISQDHPERPNVLINLAAWRGMRYEHLGTEEDLNDAIVFGLAALELVPEYHHDRSSAEHNLQSLLSMQSDHHGEVKGGRTILQPRKQASATTISRQNDGDILSNEPNNQSSVQIEKPCTTLDFGSSPSLDDIRLVISTASSNNDEAIFTGEFKMHWPILEFCERELDPGTDLHKVVTLTGTPTCAETDSCEEFVKRIWGSSALVDFLVEFIQDPSATRHAFKFGEDSHITIDVSNNDQSPEGASSTVFSISGPVPEVVQVVQQLAWLTAAFTLPTQDALTVSTAVMEVTRPGLFEIRARKIALEVPERDPTGLEGSETCWHGLLHGAVLAYGFPTSERGEGRGLEIPFDLMVGFADIRTQIEIGEGATLLGGDGIVLYPTKLLQNGVQWHCAKVKDDDYVKSGAGPSSARVLAHHDINKLASHRTFLGYYPQAEVLLGTRELVESGLDQDLETDFPVAPPRIELANEGAFSSGLSVHGIFSMNFSRKYVVSKTLRVSLQGRGYHDLVDEAHQRPTIIYDGETKSAWLVSEMSAVLHIALSHLSSPHVQDRRHTGLGTLEGEWPQLPYAGPAFDGGGEARRVCKQPENCKIELWMEDAKTKTFGNVIEDILRDFRTIRESIIAQGKATRVWPMPKTGLRGWEYTDLVTRRGQICQKEVPREGHAASWWDLGDIKDSLVIVGHGFGRLIRPKDSAKHYVGLIDIPPGSRLLIASKPCLNVLQEEEGLILGSLEWRSAAKHQSSCNSYCDSTSCSSIQILRKRGYPWDHTEAPRQMVLDAQAVIFGDSKHYHSALLAQQQAQEQTVPI